MRKRIVAAVRKIRASTDALRAVERRRKDPIGVAMREEAISRRRQAHGDLIELAIEIERRRQAA